MADSSHAPRYASLDGYRFLAASAVVLFHFDPDFHLGLAAWVPAIARLSTFVDFFFMLSGFVIAVGYWDRLASWADYTYFLRARFARIYPLHLATLGIFLAFIALGSVLHVPVNHPEHTALSGLPANLLLLQSWGILDHPSFNVPSWSISAEWFVYIAAPLFFLLARRLHVAINLVLTGLFIAGMAYLRSRAGLGSWMDATYDFGMLRAVPTFFLGILLAQLIQKTAISWAPSWWSVHALFALAVGLLEFDIPRETLLPAFALVIAAAALADRGGKPSVMKGQWFVALGQGSYALYMLHVLLSIPTLLALRRLQLLDTSWSLLAAIWLYIGTALLSIVSYRYFETPVRKRLGSPLCTGRFLASNRTISQLRLLDRHKQY